MKRNGLLLVTAIMLACAAPHKAVQPANKTTLDTQLENLSDQIVLSLERQKKSKIAVIEFSDLQGHVTTFGRYLAEELTTRLFRSGQFEVIERQLLNKVMEEQKLVSSGIIDAQSAITLGRILGVEAIASGTVTDLGTSVKVNARLISTETGGVFAVASVEIVKDQVVRRLMGPVISEPGVVTTGTDDKPTGSPTEIKFLELDGLRIELHDCTLQNRKVICRLSISNPGEDDREFTIMYGSRYKTEIFDNLGNEYPISAVRFANKFYRMRGLSQYESVKKKIVAGTTVAAELHFEKVSSSAKNITLLQINCGSSRPGLEFRKIELIKFP